MLEGFLILLFLINIYFSHPKTSCKNLFKVQNYYYTKLTKSQLLKLTKIHFVAISFSFILNIDQKSVFAYNA